MLTPRTFCSICARPAKLLSMRFAWQVHMLFMWVEQVSPEGAKQCKSCEIWSLKNLNMEGGGGTIAKIYGPGSRRWFLEQLHGAGAVQWATIGFTMGEKGEGSTAFKLFFFLHPLSTTIRNQPLKKQSGRTGSCLFSIVLGLLPLCRSHMSHMTHMIHDSLIFQWNSNKHMRSLNLAPGGRGWTVYRLFKHSHTSHTSHTHTPTQAVAKHYIRT